MAQPFFSDINAARRRAVPKPAYHAVVGLLQQALSTSVPCILRYKRHALIAEDLEAWSTARRASTHAAEGKAHAERVCERIVSLGGQPDLSTQAPIMRGDWKEALTKTVSEVLLEDLAEERAAAGVYERLLALIGEDDPASRWLVGELLLVEAQHAEDMKGLLRALKQ